MLRENEYFGNQHIQPLIEDLAEEMVQYRQTPLDDRALQIFNEEYSEPSKTMLIPRKR